MGNLKAHVERLEALRPKLSRQSHQIILEEGETRGQAQVRYERETGREISAQDLVIVHVIVAPREGMPK